MGMSAGPSRGVKNEINVTPLVDVVLVLLIIFMVVTPMLQRGKDVDLPKAKNIAEKEGDKTQDPMILSITPDKKMYLETDEHTEDTLEDALREELLKAPSRVILLKGDNSLVFADVKKAMNVARRANADRISLGVEEKK